MKTETKFVVCIENKNYPASLEFGKIYRVIEDEKAAAHKMLASLTNPAKIISTRKNPSLRSNP